MKINKSIGFVVSISFMLSLISCIPVGELQEDFRSVKLQGAKSAEIELDFGAGELEVFGGAEELMEGVFQYNIELWKPEIENQMTESKAFLSVRQGNSSGIPAGNGKNFWDISLNEKIPIDLIVDIGAGEGDLHLQSLNLRSLNIDMGVGDLSVDLSGFYSEDVEVLIDGGVGSTTVYLPRDIGVMVHVDKGIGSINSRDFIKKGDHLVNEAYGKTENVVRVDIDTGIGSITLKLR
jgi:hypothetical protein